MLSDIELKQQSTGSTLQQIQMYMVPYCLVCCIFSHLNENKFKKAAGRSVISHQYVHAVIPLIFVSGSSVGIAAVPFTFYL